MTFRNQAETLIADSKHPHNTIGATPLASYAHTTVTLNTSGIITKPVMPTITQSDNKTDDEDDNMDTNDKGDGRNNTTPPDANNTGEPSTPPDGQGHPDGHDGEVDRALPQADTTAGGNGSANTDKPQATTFGSGQYSGRTQRPNRNCKTSHANKSYGFIHLNVNTGYNTSLAAGYTKQIGPTHMTFPILKTQGVSRDHREPCQLPHDCSTPTTWQAIHCQRQGKWYYEQGTVGHSHTLHRGSVQTQDSPQVFL